MCYPVLVSPALGMLKQKRFHKCKASFGYIVSSKFESQSSFRALSIKNIHNSGTGEIAQCYISPMTWVQILRPPWESWMQYPEYLKSQCHNKDITGNPQTTYACLRSNEPPERLSHTRSKMRTNTHGCPLISTQACPHEHTHSNTHNSVHNWCVFFSVHEILTTN